MIDLDEWERRANEAKRDDIVGASKANMLAVIRELRAARSVVEEARQYHNQNPTVISSYECRLCAALAAYDAAVKEQPSGEPR